jgi:transposase-like protein
MNIISIYRKFPTEEACIAHLEKARWGGKIICPYCASEKTCAHNQKHTRQNLQCQTCTRSFSVTVGTIFHHTHLPLQKWFLAISLVLNAKKGISSRQLARDLELPVKTAWSLAHRIRKAFATEQRELLEGIFEMDETYIRTQKDDDDQDWDGSKRRKNNTSVVAIKQRGGDIKAFATHNTTHVTLINLALKVAKQGSEIQTDEYSAYSRFKEYYTHKTVNHSKEYVSRDGTHCNGVEGFWALLKRGIRGQFHWISKKYLQNYINEFEFRYNKRVLTGEVVFGEVLTRMLRV